MGWTRRGLPGREARDFFKTGTRVTPSLSEQLVSGSDARHLSFWLLPKRHPRRLRVSRLK